MKKVNIKSGLIGLLMGVLLTSGIGVVAVTLTADQVKYTPSNDKFTATNVKEAMDEIYKIADYEIPADTYFYDSETSGEDIVRYKKVDGKYYICDKNGKVTNETEQDVSNLTLKEYIGATENSLNIGNAAFSNNNFVLGNEPAKSNVATGTFTATTSGTTIDLGFKPKYVFIYVYYAGVSGLLLQYNVTTGEIKRSYTDGLNVDFTSMYTDCFSVNETGFWYKAYADGYARETIYYAW